MAAGRIGLESGLAARLSGMRAGPWAEPLRFFGRHGLAFYLIHQPVLIGTLWLVSAVVPSEAALPETRFIEACEASCRQTGDEAFCRAFCFCTLDGLSASGKLDALMSKGSDAGLDDEIAAMAGECRAAAGTGLESEP
jgi:uncharacterized membrane protein